MKLIFWISSITIKWLLHCKVYMTLIHYIFQLQCNICLKYKSILEIFVHIYNKIHMFKIIWLFSKNLYGPFLWMGFNCLKATELTRGESLLFTTQFPGVLGTHLIDLWKAESTLEPPSGFEAGTLCFYLFHRTTNEYTWH